MSVAQRWRNLLIARLRIGIEYVIAGVKRCRSVKEVLRNTQAGYSDLLMVIACGLHNWRSQHRHPVPTLNLIALCQQSNFG